MTFYFLRPSPRQQRALVACGITFGLIACQRLSPAPADVTGRYEPDSGKLVALTFDSNRDGRPDMTASMDGAAVRTVEVDEDYDGLPDRWEFYDSSPEPEESRSPGQPRLVRVERVVRTAGREARREAFVDGALVWAHEDRDGDGRPDRWETYVDGGLLSLELDTDGTGKADRRLRYEADRMVVEVDRNETGAFTPAPPDS